MELNSIDDVNALVEIQKIAQIQRLEDKIRKLGYFPRTAYLVIAVFYCFRLAFSQIDLSFGYLDAWLIDVIFTGSIMSSTCLSNGHRMDLIRDLFKLQYGK